MFLHFLNYCQTSIWQHPMQSRHGIQLCGIAKSYKWQRLPLLAFANTSQIFWVP